MFENTWRKPGNSFLQSKSAPQFAIAGKKIEAFLAECEDGQVSLKEVAVKREFKPVPFLLGVQKADGC